MKHFLNLAVLLLAACHSDDIADAVRDPARLIQTDRTEYTLVPESVGRGFEISLTYRNSLSDTLYIPNCRETFGVTLQKKAGNNWIDDYSVPVNQCLSRPISISPGGTYATTLSIWGAPSGSNFFPQLPKGGLNGIYRLAIWEVVKHYSETTPHFGEQVGEELRVSNGFKLIDH